MRNSIKTWHVMVDIMYGGGDDELFHCEYFNRVEWLFCDKSEGLSVK